MRLYSIGQVSTILGMPVKTIRYYDEIGLCSPSETDKISGYRHYSIDDIMRLDMIRCLGRELGMPLRTIGDYLDNHSDTRILKEYMRQQEREIDTEIERLLERRALLNDKLNAIIHLEMTDLLSPFCVRLPERTIYTCEQSSGSHEEALLSIRRMASPSKDVDKHRLYLLKNSIEEGSSGFSWDEFIAGTDVPSSYPGATTLTLDSGLYAVINYRNERENRRQAYRTFREYVDATGLSPKGMLIYEYALLDVTTVRMDDMIIRMQVRLEET